MEPIKQPRSGIHKKGRSNQFTQPTKNKYPKDYSRCSFALAIAAAPAGRNVTGLLKIHPLNVAVADPVLLVALPELFGLWAYYVIVVIGCANKY